MSPSHLGHGFSSLTSSAADAVCSDADARQADPGPKGPPSAEHRLRILEGAASDLVSHAPIQELLDRIAARAADALHAPGHLLAVRLPTGERHLRVRGTGAALAGALGEDGVTLSGAAASRPGLAVLSVPVASERQCYGVLAAAAHPGQDFSPGDTDALAAYARHAAVTLDIEGCVVEAQEHGETARLLLQLSQTLAQQSTVSAVAASIADAIPALSGADRSAVVVWDAEPGKVRVAGMSGWSGELAEKLADYVATVQDSPELSELLTHATPMLVDRSGSKWANAIFDEFDICAFAAVPIVAGKGLTGLVVAYWSDKAAPKSLDGALTERLSGLAGLAAVALDNVRLLETTRYQALHDPLTGLPNRALLEDRLEAALARAGRDGRRVGLLFCDVNRFKRINDSLGHAAGDTALRHVAAKLRAAVRRGDTVARYSGDEFVILLPDIEAPLDVEQVAARIRASLAPGVEVNGRKVFVDVAIGSSISGPLFADGQDGADALSRAAHRLIEQADLEMYRNRAHSRGQVAPDVTRESTLRLETDLRGAARRGELRVQYQPQIDVSSNAVIGAEALVRWQHPELGLLPPGEFIPLAEDSRLILEVGAYVLEEACRAGADLHTQGHQIEISVNVSAVQLADPGFTALVRDTLAGTGFHATALTLEITESQAVSENAANDSNLHELRALGVAISIDDFGTGYSSLAQLHRLPVTEVKIDRSFTNRLTDEEEPSSAFVAAIVGLGHGLGLRVVAEGVETTDQLNALRAMGCERAQGYLFGKPGDIKALEDLLRANRERDDSPAKDPLAMAAPAGAVRWTLLTDVPGALTSVSEAAAAAGFETESVTETEVRVYVPRSLLKRQRPAMLIGSLAPVARGVEISWMAGNAGALRHTHLLAIEQQLPEGAVYYHGATAAAARAGLPEPALGDLRNIAGLLSRDEIVRAMGQGHLDDKDGYVILTGHRLLVVEAGQTGSKPPLDVCLGSIERLSMGKRTTGETIRLEKAGQTTEISRLGHGEGYEIAQVFRDAMNERDRAAEPRETEPRETEPDRK
jgi:diguanylate cyclase (GGDEF)-like protein